MDITCTEISQYSGAILRVFFEKNINDFKKNPISLSLNSAIFFLILTLSLIWQGNTDQSILLIFFALMLSSYIVHGVAWVKQKSFRITKVHFLLFLWTIWISIPILLNVVDQTAVFGLFQCNFWLLGFAFIESNIAQKRLWQLFIYIHWLLGAVSIILSWQQFFIWHQMPSGFFADKNVNGGFLMLLLLTLLINFFSNPRFKECSSLNNSKIYNAFYLINIYLISFTILIVLSRGVILSFICSFSLFMLLTWKQLPKKQLYIVLTVLGLSFITLILFHQEAIAHRLELLHNEESRLVIWSGVWDLWKNTPWYGLGLFNFRHYYSPYSLPGDGSSLQYAHNDLLQLFVETGFPGLFIILGIAIVLLTGCINYFKKTVIDSARHIEHVGLFILLCCILSLSLVNFNFYIVLSNILLGCYLGFVHQVLESEGVLTTWNFKLNKKQLLGLIFIVTLLVTSMMYIIFRFTISAYYFAQTQHAIKIQDTDAVIKLTKKAVDWLDLPPINLRQGLIILDLATNSQSPAVKNQLTHLAEQAFLKTLKQNPYNASASYHLALLNGIYFDNILVATKYLKITVKNNPHLSSARLNLAKLLEKQNLIFEARNELEIGLKYQMDKNMKESYLLNLNQLNLYNHRV